MEKLELSYKWKQWKNGNGEIQKYRTYYVLYNGIEIPIKPADYTAAQILNQAINCLELEKK